MKKTPYNYIQEYSRWRNLITINDNDNDKNLNLKSSPTKFKINKSDKLSSAGSCFAQYVAQHLSNKGFNYIQAESCTESAGFFSANYGNIYTTSQLLQCFQRAFSDEIDISIFWKNGNIYIDKMRHSQGALNFANDQEALSYLKKHLSALREVFRTSEVFVYTLGLTEAWQEKESGITFPTCPGTVAGEFDSKIHKFINFTFSEVKQDLDIFINSVRKINPSIKIILTVSPVPLSATAIDQNIAISNGYSKSILRAVAGEVSDSYDFVEYFPSFELFSLPQFSNLYAADNRNPKESSVNMAMKLFDAYFLNLDNKSSFVSEQFKAICDESAYDSR